MHEQVLPGKTKDILALIGEKKALPPQTYLAGGTACALQLGHRISYDLDYYTPKEFDIELQLKLLDGLNRRFRKTVSEDQTILGEFPEIKFSLFYYSYPLVEKAVSFYGNVTAGIKDIAAMKINAIADRGLKRDFVDLFFIMQKMNLSLDIIFGVYDQKFGTLANNKAHILKSLVYFTDAEIGKDPNMLVDWNWNAIKQFFVKQVKAYEKKVLG